MQVIVVALRIPFGGCFRFCCSVLTREVLFSRRLPHWSVPLMLKEALLLSLQYTLFLLCLPSLFPCSSFPSPFVLFFVVDWNPGLTHTRQVLLDLQIVSKGFLFCFVCSDQNFIDLIEYFTTILKHFCGSFLCSMSCFVIKFKLLSS